MTVNTDAINSARCDAACVNVNFYPQAGTVDTGAYDFDSVMHYSQCAFSTCSADECETNASCPTLTVLKPNQEYQNLIGQHDHLSSGDIAGLRLLYPQGCRVSIGDNVQVVNTACLGLAIRGCAGLACEQVRRAAEGDRGSVVAGPISKDGYVWWQIRWEEDGLEGWSAEGEQGACWLTKVLPPAPCALTAGQRVRVANTQCVGLRVRDCAGLGCTRTGNRPDGSAGLILAGPELADGYTWWSIKWDSTGLTGWSAAGDGTACWLTASIPSDDPGGPCTGPDFSDQFAAGDLNSGVGALTVWDDGSGLALFAGGSFTVAGGVTANYIAKWDGTSWKPLLAGGQSGVNSTVSSLATWDDGTDEALYIGGSFTAVGGTSANRIGRWTGSSWSVLDSGTNGTVNALTVYDDGFGQALYAGGEFTSAGGISASRIARWDGLMWSPLLVASNNGVDGYAVDSLQVFDDGFWPALCAGGRFWSAGGISANRIARWDGAYWTALGTGPDTSANSVNALAVYDSDGSGPSPARLFAGGSASWYGATFVRYWDGAAWITPDGGVYGQGACIVLKSLNLKGGSALFAGGGLTTAGGNTATHVATWDGTVWSTLGTGTNGDVWRLALYDDGLGEQVYAGGSFSVAGNVNAGYIAKWNGADWRALGNGMNNGEVYSQTVYDIDGSGPQVGTLYAGGSFTTAGGVSANMVARRDGDLWTAMGSGMSGGSPSTIVYAMAGFDPDGSGSTPAYVFGTGSFTSAGGVSASNIARWDGSSWEPVGGGLNGPGFAAAVFDDGGGPDLYIAGSFNNASGIAANRIAKWDGTSWSKLGNGLNSTVTSLVVFNDGSGSALYVGGNFTNASGVSALRIARWNGSSWSAVGGGMNDEVDALAVWDDGTGPALYAGGLFTSAGGVSVNRLAKWNGSVWAPIGDGVNGQALTLSPYNDGFASALYVGGLFTTAGSVAVNRLAKWNGNAWAAMGTGMGGIVSTGTPAVRSLTVFDEDGSGPAAAGLYIGGNFTTANGVPSGRIARLGCSGPPPCAAVSILQPPTDQTTCEGGTATFRVTATGSPAIICQWRKDGQDIPDAVAATYTIHGVTATDLGSYEVVVTNPCGEATSGPAVLNVSSRAPADLDADCDVDLEDLAQLGDCSSGPGIAHGGSDRCQLADIDDDGDVDQDDFGAFQRCWSGNLPADPSCAN